MNTAPHPHLHIDLPSFLSWPRTRAGMTAAWLGVLGVVLVVANVFTAKDGSQAGLLQMEALMMIVTAPMALVAAVIAAFRNHERSVFVWIPIVVGSLFLIFVFVELTFPHA